MPAHASAVSISATPTGTDPVFTPADIKHLRARYGLTQMAFADLIPGSAREVYRWEHGHSTPSRLALRRLAELDAAKPARPRPASATPATRTSSSRGQATAPAVARVRPPVWPR